ncbi:MAG: ABC transporter permease [Bacteroidota bacterium]
MFFRKKILPGGSLSAKSWIELRKNKTAVISMVVIAFATLTAILGYLITPDNTPFANDQHLETAACNPGFRVQQLLVRKNEPAQECSFLKKIVYGCPSDFSIIPISAYQFRKDEIVLTPFDKAGYDGDTSFRLVFKLADVLFALADTAQPTSAPGQETDMDGKPVSRNIRKMQRIITENHIVNRTYLLGTDRFGRDVLSRLMIGTRVSLSVGFISVFISLVLGILLGSLAGFFRGRTDDLIIWFINVIWSIPTLLLVIAITFALGKGFWQVFIAVGLTMWVEVARVVRGQILSIREKEFVEAARALGYKNSRIILRHILPNTMGPVIVISAANFASAILIEAGLSFLGIGVQPPMPSWGTMVRENYAYIILDNPWLAILPGLCIMILVLAFMLIGNGLRDALDVKAGPVN